MENYIGTLKAKDNFREDGWKRFKKELLIVGTSTSVFFAILFAIGGSLEIAIFVFFAVCFFWICLYLYWSAPHLLYNEGEIAVGRVTYSSYNWVIAPHPTGWGFGYEFERDGKTYKGHMSLGKGKYYHFKGGVLPLQGSEITVFYENNNPKKNCPLIPRTFFSTCLKKSRYEEVMTRYFKKRKGD